jgi:7-cyano-7-deazaguanine synthase
MMQGQSSEIARNSRALVLCSSGLDSTYNLLKAKTEFSKTSVLFFDYGQKAYSQEYVHVKKLCETLNVDMTKLDLPWYRGVNSTLLSQATEITRFASVAEADASGKPAEWVPNRNGVFASAAAAVAESRGHGSVVIGINREEAARYPDNTQEFMDRANDLFKISTLSHPKLVSYSVSMTKVEIFSGLMELSGQLGIKNIKEYIWSCYDSYEKMCGSCESCLRLKQVIREHRQESEWKDRFLR